MKEHLPPCRQWPRTCWPVTVTTQPARPGWRAVGRAKTIRRSGPARAGYRQQALSWLRADLAMWNKQLTGGKSEPRARLRQVLSHWQSDTDLSGLREEAALVKLPEAEQKACRQLWADVKKLLEGVEKKPLVEDKK